MSRKSTTYIQNIHGMPTLPTNLHDSLGHINWEVKVFWSVITASTMEMHTLKIYSQFLQNHKLIPNFVFFALVNLVTKLLEQAYYVWCVFFSFNMFIWYTGNSPQNLERKRRAFTGKTLEYFKFLFKLGYLFFSKCLKWWNFFTINWIFTLAAAFQLFEPIEIVLTNH